MLLDNREVTYEVFSQTSNKSEVVASLDLPTTTTLKASFAMDLS